MPSQEFRDTPERCGNPSPSRADFRCELAVHHATSHANYDNGLGQWEIWSNDDAMVPQCESEYITSTGFSQRCERHLGHRGACEAHPSPQSAGFVVGGYQWHDARRQVTPEGVIPSWASGDRFDPARIYVDRMLRGRVSPERIAEIYGVPPQYVFEAQEPRFTRSAVSSATVSPDTRTTPQPSGTDQEDEMRTCTRCQQRLSTDSFRWQPTRGSFHRWCRDCERASQREAARTRGTTNRATRRSQGMSTEGRAFGIEIELTGPSRRVIEAALNAEGIRVINRGYGSTTGSNWELKTDGSVRGEGLELVSPKLSGAGGFAALEAACRALRAAGATVDRSCGVHVHVDYRGQSINQIRTSLMPLVERQATLLAMNAPSRSTNSYVPKWTSRDITTLRDARSLSNLAYLPRGVVNTQAYGRHGSIEFRSHGGCTHFGRLSAWVRMLLAAVEFGQEGVLPQDVRGFCGALGLSQEDTNHLARFVDAAANVEAAEYAPEVRVMSQADVDALNALRSTISQQLAEVERLAGLVAP